MRSDTQKVGTCGDDDDHPHGDIECCGEAVSRKLASRMLLQNLKGKFGRSR